MDEKIILEAIDRLNTKTEIYKELINSPKPNSRTLTKFKDTCISLGVDFDEVFRAKKFLTTKECPVCGESFTRRNSDVSETCSYSCANTYFRSGINHPNHTPNGENSYRTICFHHHKKECVVCGEDKIVEVHHLDENHTNNDPRNLVPLCPTHHKYWHSRYRYLVEDKVKEFVGVG